MPNRIIKESICSSESVDSLSWFEEVFFYRLIVNCDDYGRMDARPAILMAKLFPLKDITNKQIETALNKLSTAGMVKLYVCDQKPYLQLATWERHQSIRAKKSKYPAPEETIHPSSEIICKQMKSSASKCPRNPIQSESNPNTNPNPKPNPNARAMAADESGLLEYIQKYFGILSSSSIQEIRACLEEETQPQLIRRAVDISVDNGVPKWSYCRSILNTWLVNGVKTLEAAEAYESRRKQERAPQRSQVGQDNTSFADIAREMEGESYDSK